MDVNNYFDYFNSLFLNNKELSTTGDITPSYACLPIEAFEFIKKNLEEKRFNVKVIFIMRDPVYRILSHALMIISRYKMNKGKLTDLNLQSILENADKQNLDNEVVRYIYNHPKCIVYLERDTKIQFII